MGVMFEVDVEGWVGSSAALVGMASKWQRIAMHSSADMFAYMEEQAAQGLKVVGDQADAVEM